jgi:trans-2,3-dihydro-3-hydroxyanthranilate isomerase
MSKLSFYLVDVFAREKFAGNQLAVVLNASSLSSEHMQQIANEMHFSETAFVLSNRQRNGGYDVRIFTPARELPFSGHPTLGTAYVIKHLVAEEAVNRVVLNLMIGHIPVVFEKDAESEEVGWMEQVQPSFGITFCLEEFSQILQLSASVFDVHFPIQAVSTGLPFIIVPLKKLDAVRNAKINLDRLDDLAKLTRAGILVFCPQTYDDKNDLNVRVFADMYGVPEDPATGSGNGCLAAYLSQHRYFGSDRVDIRVEQGCEIRRPSLLLLRTQAEKHKIRVLVGGKVIPVARGELI